MLRGNEKWLEALGADSPVAILSKQFRSVAVRFYLFVFSVIFIVTRNLYSYWLRRSLVYHGAATMRSTGKIGTVLVGTGTVARVL